MVSKKKLKFILFLFLLYRSNQQSRFQKVRNRILREQVPFDLSQRMKIWETWMATYLKKDAASTSSDSLSQQALKKLPGNPSEPGALSGDRSQTTRFTPARGILRLIKKCFLPDKRNTGKQKRHYNCFKRFMGFGLGREKIKNNIIHLIRIRKTITIRLPGFYSSFLAQ